MQITADLVVRILSRRQTCATRRAYLSKDIDWHHHQVSELPTPTFGSLGTCAAILVPGEDEGGLLLERLSCTLSLRLRSDCNQRIL